MLSDGVVMLALLLEPSAAAPAAASSRVVAHVAAGYAAPLHQAGDLFDGGFEISGGATLHFSPGSRAGLRLELGYDHFDATHQVIDSAGFPRSARVDDGYQSVTRLAVDLLYDFSGKGRVGGYFAIGTGGYSTYRTLTETVIVGGVSCDPIFPECIAFGEGMVIENSDRSTTFGNDASLALTIAMGTDKQLYVEASYRRVHTEEPMQYVPIVLGFRF
jgi:hypothetical protein